MLAHNSTFCNPLVPDKHSAYAQKALRNLKTSIPSNSLVKDFYGLHLLTPGSPSISQFSHKGLAQLPCSPKILLCLPILPSPRDRQCLRMAKLSATSDDLEAPLLVYQKFSFLSSKHYSSVCFEIGVTAM